MEEWSDVSSSYDREKMLSIIVNIYHIIVYGSITFSIDVTLGIRDILTDEPRC